MRRHNGFIAVFPAYAGVSPENTSDSTPPFCLPRLRGGEPSV